MADQRNRLVLLGVFVTVVLILFGYLAMRVGSVRTGGGIEVETVFDDAQGLVENGSVRIAGIQVGSIGKLRVDNGKARITLYLNPDVGMKRNVAATIKAKSLLGEKFIELIPQPGDAPALQDGDVIENTYVQAELPDLASQIGPLLAKINPDDVGRLVRVISTILEQNEKDIPKVVESLGNLTVNLDRMIERNGPKIDQIVDAAFDATTKAGPKVERLIDTTQHTLDNANKLIEANGPRIEQFAVQLSKFDLERINRMIGEVDTAMQGMPETMKDARQLLTRTNALMGGFEGLTWFDLKHLIRDEGVVVRMMARGDDDIEAERAQWKPPLKMPEATPVSATE